LVISLGITTFFYFRVMRNQAAKPKTKRIIVAASTIQPGTPVVAESVGEVDWPENLSLEGMIEKKDDVVGHILIYPVAAKEPILKRDLASGSSFGLSAKIPDGMRAMAVKTNEINNVAGFIFPGSHVDVLMTIRGDNNTTVTRTVLQNVLVLSTGARMDPDPNAKPENVTVVTLLVTPEQSQKVALAQVQGSLNFVLRNGNDSAQPETPSVSLAELDGQPKKPAAPETVRAKKIVVAEKARPEYKVETVAGGKVSVAKFPE
jgi:pilus assembly protein CpaB